MVFYTKMTDHTKGMQLGWIPASAFFPPYMLERFPRTFRCSMHQAFIFENF